MLRYSKIVVMLIVVLNVVFVASVLYIYSKIGNEPTSLIVAWFSFTTGELWLLSGIKREKVKQEGVSYENCGNKYPI